MQTSSSHFLDAPQTRVGKWSAGLMIVFILLFLINIFFLIRLEGTYWWRALLPIYAIGMLASGLAAGIAAMVALIKKHEHSWVIWLAILPAVWTLFMLAGELFFPH